MGTHKTRLDRTCKNCKHVVEKRYCSNCGQENTESRQSFGHLAAHFVEDFTHYDNAFWKTIKFLLFRPGRLTNEFIAGRRMTYVPPVKLYIFISFLTFFLLSILTTPENTADDFIQINHDTKDNDVDIVSDYSTVAEFDSIENSKPAEQRLSSWEQLFTRKMITIDQKYTFDEFRGEVVQSVTNNLPKVLFLYMPFSALGLWLFHGKKRWYYFDHGIFTLHYFSFVLLLFSGFLILQSIIVAIEPTSNVAVLLFLIMIGWWFFYFFRSHRRFYGESRLISRLKSFALFVINMFFIIIFLGGLFIYSMVNIQ